MPSIPRRLVGCTHRLFRRFERSMDKFVGMTGPLFVFFAIILLIPCTIAFCRCLTGCCRYFKSNKGTQLKSYSHITSLNLIQLLNISRYFIVYGTQLWYSITTIALSWSLQDFQPLTLVVMFVYARNATKSNRNAHIIVKYVRDVY